MNDNDDLDDLDDIIRLHCSTEPLKLETLEFLDPGIIDLECDSEEDCGESSPASLSDRDCLPQEPHLITSSPKPETKPLSVEIVDCYKYPWFFDSLTKKIVEENISVQSIEEKHISDSRCNVNFDNNKLVDSTIPHNNKDSLTFKDPVTMLTNDKSGSKDDLIQNNERSISDIISLVEKIKSETIKRNKTNSMEEVFARKKIYHQAKGVENNIDLDICNALKQRNKTKVDLKKNRGLVGMKIQRFSNKIIVGNRKNTHKYEQKPKSKQPTNERVVMNDNVVRSQLSSLNNENVSNVESTNSSKQPYDNPTILNDVNLFDENHKVAEEIYRLIIGTESSKPLCSSSDVLDVNKVNNKKGSIKENKRIDDIQLQIKGNKNNTTNTNLIKSSECIVIDDDLSNANEQPEINYSNKDTAKWNTLIDSLYIKNLQIQMWLDKTKDFTEKTNRFPNIISASQAERRAREKENTKFIKEHVFAPIWKPTLEDESQRNRSASNVGWEINHVHLQKSILYESNILSEKGSLNSPRMAVAEKYITNKKNCLDDVNKTKISELNDLLKEFNQVPNIKRQYQSVGHVSKCSTSDTTLSNYYNKSEIQENKNTLSYITHSKNESLNLQHTNNQITHRTINTPMVTKPSDIEKYPIQTIVSNRENSLTENKFDPTAIHKLNNSISTIEAIQMQNYKSKHMTEKLTVQNSMQLHTLYKPDQESNYQNHLYSYQHPVDIPSQNLLDPRYKNSVLQNSNKMCHSPANKQHVHSKLKPIEEKSQMLERSTPIIMPNLWTLLSQDVFHSNMPTSPSYGRCSASNVTQQVVPRHFPERGPDISQVYRPPSAHFSPLLNYQLPFNMGWPPPLPPPPPPSSPHSPFFLSAPANNPPRTQMYPAKTLDESVIGRNSNGAIKKINIANPIAEQKTTTENGVEIIVPNLNDGNVTPLYDETIFNKTSTINTKNGMMMEFNISTQQVKSHILNNSEKEVKNQVDNSATANEKRESQNDIKCIKHKDQVKQSNIITNHANKYTLEPLGNVEHNAKNSIIPSTNSQKHHQSQYKAPAENKDRSSNSYENVLRNMTEKLISDIQSMTEPNDSIAAKSISLSDQIKQNHLNIEKPQAFDITGAPSDISVHSKSTCGNIARETNNTTFSYNSSPNNGNKTTDFQTQEISETRVILPAKRLRNEESNTDEPSYPKCKPGPLSKKVKVINIHSKAYTAPELPIPTYKKELLDNFCQNPIEDNTKMDKPNSYSKIVKSNVNESVIKEEENLQERRVIKRISIEEYKRRCSEKRKESNMGNGRKISTTDSDLGYDSDGTAKL